MTGLACPVCDAIDSIGLDRRRDVPIGQNLVFRDQRAAIECVVGELDMRRCMRCAFVWNAAFDTELMRYDATYDNEQNMSDVFRRHVEEVAERAAELAPAAGEVSVLEVGCGQGSFLGMLAGRLGTRLGRATGFDPAWRGDKAALLAGVDIVDDYFSPDTLSRLSMSPDIVISRHTIEHVPDPIRFLRAIRAAAKPGATVLIETPTVDWILETGTFFDFFYEHCSIFNPTSIDHAMRKAGFEAPEVDLLFGRQFLLARTTAAGAGLSDDHRPSLDPRGATDLGYREKRETYLSAYRDALRSVRGERIALWGGASKGVTVALMLEQDREQISCAIDINPAKQGGFMPGSGIPILSPNAAREAGITTAFIMNPNYADEIRKYCAANGLAFDLRVV